MTSCVYTVTTLGQSTESKFHLWKTSRRRFRRSVKVIFRGDSVLDSFFILGPDCHVHLQAASHSSCLEGWTQSRHCWHIDGTRIDVGRFGIIDSVIRDDLRDGEPAPRQEVGFGPMSDWTRDPMGDM